MRTLFAIILTSIFVASLAGCATTGKSIGGSMSAPVTIRQPEFLNPEIAGYAQRIFSPLIANGFRVGYTDDPDALRLEINFDPSIMSTSVKINLIKPGVGVVASAESVNHGMGTMSMRDKSISNLVEAASEQFRQQLSLVHFKIEADKNNYQSCFNALAASPEFSIIKEKVGLAGTQDQTFSMLADNTKPSKEEIHALKQWGNMRDACIKIMHESKIAQRTPLALLNVIDAASNAEQTLLVALVNGSLTYSEYSKKRSALTVFENESIAQIEAEFRKETEDSRFKGNQLALEAQRNSILQQKNVTDSIVQQQQLHLQQQQINVNNRMKSTNCNVNGSNVNCLSF